MPQHITFDVSPGLAAITKRAAARLQLPVIDCADGTFRVELADSVDAYRLGDLSVQDPAWAQEFLLRAVTPSPGDGDR